MHISRLAPVQAGKAGIDYADKSAFLWISVIRLPDFVPRKKEKAGLLVGGIPACGDAEIGKTFRNSRRSISVCEAIRFRSRKSNQNCSSVAYKSF